MVQTTPNIVLDSTKSEDRRVALGTLVGTAVEWYDFFIYANAAAVVLAPLFFDPFVASSGDTAGRLVSFATVGISFFFRPLGAAVAGHFGDKLGRKVMLVATLMLMGAATFLIGLLPTYEQIGYWAPALLLVLRVCQGFAAGGEWGGAALMAVEHAPANKRGLFGGFPQIGVPVGMLMATVALWTVDALTTEAQFMSWGWRIPFLFSLLLIVIGMVIRLGVSESPVMEEIAESEEQIRLPIVEMFRTSWKPLIQCALIFMGNGVAGYMIAGGYVLSYTVNDLFLDRGTILTLISLTSAAWIGTTIFAAWLSDKITRKKTYFIGFGMQLAWVFPLFVLIDTENYILIALGLLVLSIPLGLTYGQQSAMFAEAFPAKIRYSGAGLAYAIGAILGGAFAPLIATALQAEFQTSKAVAGYLFAVTIIAVIATMTVTDRTGRPLTPEADRELNTKIEKIAAKTDAIPVNYERGAGF